MKRRVAYLPLWQGPLDSWVDRLPWEGMTHLFLAFWNPDEQGRPVPIDLESARGLPRVAAEARRRGVRLGMSLGGGLNPALDHWRHWLAPERVGELALNLAEYARAAGFDGIDVDLEGPAIDGNYGGFVLALRRECDRLGLELSAAVATWNGANYSEEALAALDFVGLMAYDSYGCWSAPGEHATLQSAEAQVSYWCEERRVAPEKLVLGIPFYGWWWRRPADQAGDEHGDGCQCRSTAGETRGAWSRAEIADQLPHHGDCDWVELEHEGERLLLSHNGPTTLRSKAELGRQLGGILIWEIAQDGEGEHSLMPHLE